MIDMVWGPQTPRITRSKTASAKRGLGTAVKTIGAAVAAEAGKRIVGGWSGKRKLEFNYNKGKKLKFARMPDPANPFSKKGKYGLSTAYYRGRVKAKRRKAKSDVQKESFMARGFLQSFEEYGSITDPYCVHIGHSTHNLDIMPAVIAKAIIRRLLSKAGYEVDAMQRVLPLTYNNSAAGFSYVIYGTNQTTGAVEQVEKYASSAGTTLESIINIAGTAVSFYDLLKNMIKFPGDSAAPHNLDRIDLLVTDSAGVSNERLVCSLNLRHHKLILMSKSTIQVQNRTKGATSGDVDATAVDNQPLKGYMYQFGQGAPTLKTQGTLWNKNPVTQKGLIKKTGSEFASAVINGYTETGFREPQPPGVFAKVTGSRKLLLQPGDIKSGVIMHVYKGYFNDVIQQLGARNTGSSNIVGPVKGKSQIWSLEEQINTGGDNSIIVQFECDKVIGAYVKQARKPLMLMAHYEEPN